jgi:hypothetical protein
MSAPQAPPPCPVEWCTADHAVSSAHIGSRFGQWPTRAAVIQCIGRDVEVALMGDEVVFLSNRDVRGLAETIERVHSDSPLAAALRQAADELDRISGGGS